MTDIANWHELVHISSVVWKDPLTGEILRNKDGTPHMVQYVSVPLNAYQLGNMIGALKQADDTGDWWWELCAIVAVGMDKLGIDTITSNAGDTFTRDQIIDGAIK